MQASTGIRRSRHSSTRRCRLSQAHVGLCRIRQAAAGIHRLIQYGRLMWPDAGRRRVGIYVQAGQQARLTLIQSCAGRTAGHPAFSLGQCGETVKLEGREPISNIPPHLSRHPMAIANKELFLVVECRKRGRRCDTDLPCRSMRSQKERVRSIFGKDRLCISCYDNNMR
jgi:hypothetical protein